MNLTEPTESKQARVGREPSAVDASSSLAGLRAVATFEAAKGVLVILLAIALIFFREHAEDVVGSLLFHLHISPERKFGHAMMTAASRLSDTHIWLILLASLSYSIVRFIESWGLWYRRVWAEWFALLSGTLYLPFELLRLMEHADWERWTVLLVNIGITVYMLEIRIRACRPPRCRPE